MADRMVRIDDMLLDSIAKLEAKHNKRFKSWNKRIEWCVKKARL